MSDQQHNADGHDEHGIGHVVEPKILFATAAALVVLTVITVGLAKTVDFAHYDLPEINIWVAMIIATLKASLVCLFFMHLRWDRAFNSIVLVISVALVGLFITFALFDTLDYKVDLDQGDTDTVKNLLADLEAGAADHGADDH